MASTRTKQQLQGEREGEAAPRADRCSRSPRPRSPSPTRSTPSSKQQGVRRDQVDAAPAGERQAASLDGRGRCHDARFKGGAAERLPKLEANLPSAASMDPEVKRFLGVVGCAPSGERRRTPCATIASFGTGSGCRGGVPGGARAARVTTARRAGTREAGARRAARARARSRGRARGRLSHPRPRATTWACYSIAPAARKKRRLPSILWAAKRDLITLRIDEKLGQIRQRADRRTRPCPPRCATRSPPLAPRSTACARSCRRRRLRMSWRRCVPSSTAPLQPPSRRSTSAYSHAS